MEGDIKMYTILVVEDDLDLNKLISDTLNLEGYKVKEAYDGYEAKNMLEQNTFDLVLLDLMIPKLNGLDILQSLRKKANTPVCIISSKRMDSDKVLGLGLGADDYLTKPFSISELIARVKALLRRSVLYTRNMTEDLRFEDLVLKEETHEFYVRNKLVPLSKMEFQVMKLLMENPYKVYSKSRIFRLVWKGEFVRDDNNVMVMIRRLRKKIEVDSSNPKYIKTVWGIGYKLGEEGE